MKKALKSTIAALILAAPMMANGAAATHFEPVKLDPRDQISLQRGAQIFVNNCLSCHSASAMRYNRLQDIGLTEDEIKKNLMFTTDKIGDVMQAHMKPADGKKWFGNAPPDLTLIARSRGNDYIYAYLRGFYQDAKTPTGWNNTVLPNAAMPHALWEQEGIKTVKYDQDGKIIRKKDGTPEWVWVQTGRLTRMTKDGNVIATEYDNYVRDLTNFMAYMAEPSQVQRKKIGYIVLLFLFVVMLPLAYFLKKEYWKDVH